MAAYDQVLAKLKNVGSLAPPDSASPDAAKTKKRKQPAAIALPQAKGKRKLRSIEEASVPISEETVGKAAKTAALAGESSHAVAVAKAENGIAARASHTARFGRRRAGKNVRRYATLSSGTMCHNHSSLSSSIHHKRRVIEAYERALSRDCCCSYSGSDLAAILGENSMPASSASEAKSPAEEGPRRLVVDLQESISALQGDALAPQASENLYALYASSSAPSMWCQVS